MAYLEDLAALAVRAFGLTPAATFLGYDCDKQLQIVQAAKRMHAGVAAYEEARAQSHSITVRGDVTALFQLESALRAQCKHVDRLRTIETMGWRVPR